MSGTLVDKVAEAVLYEGYILHPYHASSAKNRERFTFGRVYPEPYCAAEGGAEPCVMQTQCLARPVGAGATFGGRVRFLHTIARDVCLGTWPDNFSVVPELKVDGKLHQSWHEATEREVIIPEMPLEAGREATIEYAFRASVSVETLHHHDGTHAGIIRRRQRTLKGEVRVAVESVDNEVLKITVRITNLTPLPDAEVANADAILLTTFASTHTILAAVGAEFLSLTDPPAHYALAAIGCDNTGTWPVLVGDEDKGQRDTLLSSPIILYDYPKVAPESDGDRPDSLQIDEMVPLRVMSMTDSEKSGMRNVDDFARRILERTESLGETRM
jgi:hydrogenase maturation protease